MLSIKKYYVVKNIAWDMIMNKKGEKSNFLLVNYITISPSLRNFYMMYIFIAEMDYNNNFKKRKKENG